MSKPGRQKHVPQRMCVMCRRTMDKRALSRVVNTPEDGVVIDPTGKRNGRGAYLCNDPLCWERALTSDGLAKALRTTLDDEDLARLRAARPHHNTTENE